MNKIEQTPRDIFFRSIQVDSTEDLRTYLDSACGDNDKLRLQVEELLAAHQNAGRFLGEYDSAIDTHVDSGSLQLIGQQIGPYKLLEAIGEGGMGTVYMAEQTDPVKRRVAIKLIKPGMDSKQVIARFDAERRALAMMDHPNIAKVFDAGTTESGRPYFVMELVKGLPITKFCDLQKLSTDSRLKLFRQVSQAVQHAHQKGIIHRDLKPNNILIAMYDDVPVPKVIDFGVAKATSEPLSENTFFTRFGEVVGTLAYMSPEQAQFNQLDIDTRSDIYSLGSILYELLVGEPPFEKERLKSQAFDETLRMIREEEPTKPSTKLGSAEHRAKYANTRNTTSEKLASTVSGELDWIVMKSLEKDRSRRYETANEFASDILRYLDNEPVNAGPPSAFYVMRKFVQRNRLPVLSGVVVVFALLSGIIGISLSLMHAVNAQKVTKLSLAQTEEARDEEVRQREYAEAVADFVKNDFLALTTVGGQARFNNFDSFELTKDSTLGELLDRAAKKLDDRTDMAPKIEAELRWIIGVSFREAGDFERSIEFLEKSLELRRMVSGNADEETLETQNSLGVAYDSAGQYDKAIPLLEATVETHKSQLGPGHRHTLLCVSNLAAAYFNVGRIEDAIQLFEQVTELATDSLGDDHVITLTFNANLAGAYGNNGQPEKAIPILERTLEISQIKLGPEHLKTINLMHNLGSCYKVAGDLDKAIPLLRQTLELRKSVLGSAHPKTLHTLSNLGGAYGEAGYPDKEISLIEQALQLQKSSLGPQHIATLVSMANLAVCYWRTNQLDKSIPLFEQVLKSLESNFGRNHPSTLKVAANLGVNYKQAGRLDEAIPLLEETFLASKKVPGLMFVSSTLIDAYVQKDMPERAKETAEEQLEIIRAQIPSNSLRLATNLAGLGIEFIKLNQYPIAETLLRETLEIRKEQIPEDWSTSHAQSLLGEALLKEKRFEESERLLLEGHEGLVTRPSLNIPSPQFWVNRSLQSLVSLYETWHETAPNNGHNAKAERWRREYESRQDNK